MQIIHLLGHGDAMGRYEGGEINQFLRFHKTARRSQTGHHMKILARSGIAQLENAANPFELDSHGVATTADLGACHMKRLGRFDNHVANGQQPAIPLRGECHQTGILERYAQNSRPPRTPHLQIVCNRSQLCPGSRNVKPQRSVKHRPDNTALFENS